ncbi:MAG: alpha/beta fold hydrolase [Cyanobacteria bacterium P01_A01_bin.114]
MQLPGMTSQNRLAGLLFKVGVALLIGLAFGLYSLHGLGLLNVWQLPIKPAAAFLMGGGVACLVGASVLQPPRRWLWRAVLIAVISANGLGYLGAYGLTHAKTAGQPIGFPRPENSVTPAKFGISYETKRIALAQNEWLETWFAHAPRPQGTVLLFPGNKAAKDRLLAPAQAFYQLGYDIGLVDFRGVGGSSGHTTTVGAREANDVVAVVNKAAKDRVLAPAQAFHQLGYDIVLVDFRGVGGSSGHTTTVGAREANDVVTVVNYLKQQTTLADAPLILYGVSMGSAAILKAVGQAKIQPDAIILELPFARLLTGVKTRLSAAGIPPFLTGELIVLWGSLQHGFNGFAHNPVNYAKGVDCPTLVLHGQHDKWTTQAEIDDIVENLEGQKQLMVFPDAGHQLLITVDKAKWQATIAQFLQAL